MFWLVPRNRFATSRSLAPVPNISAAASRTRSGRSQPAAIGMPHAYGIAHPRQLTRLNNPGY